MHFVPLGESWFLALGAWRGWREARQMACCLSVCPEVRGAVEEDGGVLLNLRTGRLFAMNRVGATIWRHFVGQDEFEPSDVFAFLANKYAGMDPERLRQDATSFVDRLLAQGFVGPGSS